MERNRPQLSCADPALASGAASRPAAELRRLNVFEPDFGIEEEQALVAVLRSGWVAMGPQVEAFERRFADLVGTQHAVAVSSCTAALHLTQVALGIGRGDEVIVPSLTFSATANSALVTGATPVFADIASADDWTLDPADAARRITPRTKAVIAVHYGGHPADMAALGTVCRDAGVTLIEDACHGLGGSLDGRAMGALGAAGCFSFYSNKVITTGEGGMVTTDDADLALHIAKLRSHGMTATAIDRVRGAFDYEVTEAGFNYRLDDLRAAVGLAQVDRLAVKLARRRDLVRLYCARLASIPGLSVPNFGGRGEPANYLMTVLLDGGDREAVRRRLQERGIQTSVHYHPVHLFAHYRHVAERLPITESVAARTITLPLYPRLQESDVDYVAAALQDAIG